MSEWFTNPLFWIVFLSLLSVAAGAIFAFGQWKGKVDSERSLLKELIAEVRSDIKEILRRLPSHIQSHLARLRADRDGGPVQVRAAVRTLIARHEEEDRVRKGLVAWASRMGHVAVRRNMPS